MVDPSVYTPFSGPPLPSRPSIGSASGLSLPSLGSPRVASTTAPSHQHQQQQHPHSSRKNSSGGGGNGSESGGGRRESVSSATGGGGGSGGGGRRSSKRTASVSSLSEEVGFPATTTAEAVQFVSPAPPVSSLKGVKESGTPLAGVVEVVASGGDHVSIVPAHAALLPLSEVEVDLHAPLLEGTFETSRARKVWCMRAYACVNRLALVCGHPYLCRWCLRVCA